MTSSQFWSSALALAPELSGTDTRRLTLGLLELRRLWELFDSRRRWIALEANDARSSLYALGDAQRSQMLERAELYRNASVHWLPRAARWPTLCAYSGQPNLGRLVDGAVLALELESPALQGKIPRQYGSPWLRPHTLAQLLHLVDKAASSAPGAAAQLDGLIRSCPDSSTHSVLGSSPQERLRSLRSLSSQSANGKLLDRLDEQLRELDRLIDPSRRSRSGREDV